MSFLRTTKSNSVTDELSRDTSIEFEFVRDENRDWSGKSHIFRG